MTEQNSMRWRSFLGLANRAGKVVSGEETVLRAVRQQKAYIVLLAMDASERTNKTITNKCKFYGVPLKQVPDREVLGQAIGQPARVIVAVTDQGFGRQLKRLLDES
jgi:ribosomal protein L7Ae-like RNA K-turn-binding protein